VKTQMSPQTVARVERFLAPVLGALERFNLEKILMLVRFAYHRKHFTAITLVWTLMWIFSEYDVKKAFPQPFSEHLNRYSPVEMSLS
jgi:hypothetical protein